MRAAAAGFTRAANAALVLLLLLAGCRTGQNFPGTEGPRYAGGTATAEAPRDTLRIVTFNVEMSARVDSAIALLLSDSALRGADVVLLQEMDDDGTRRIAAALNMAYVYYPASFRYKIQRNFGNAVLSRWPIVEDAKLVLPHISPIVQTQRTATAATIRVGSELVRVYSAHLGTVVNVTVDERLNQLRAILDDGERYARVILGGDMNDESVGILASQRGYHWPTQRGPRTTLLGRWDHIFLKGLRPRDHAAAGTVLDARGASDHRPVWAVVVLR